ncbi:MAG: hypothetical protein ACOCQU_02115 [Halolamina sp.]
MTSLSRRGALATVAAAIAGFAGCGEGEPPTSGERMTIDTATGSGTTTQADTDSATNGTDSTTAGTDSPSAEDLVPADGERWTRTEFERREYATLGVESGIRADYRDGDGLAAAVVVLEDPHDPERRAETLHCQVGWPVVLVVDAFAIAAGTGTPQRTHTPETPPQMDRTAVPETTDDAVSLLATSPELSSDRIEADRRTDADC